MAESLMLKCPRYKLPAGRNKARNLVVEVITDLRFCAFIDREFSCKITFSDTS
jgi:hypothetical protein